MGDALGSALAAMRFLARVDMTQLSGEAVAEALIAMEQMDAAQAAVRAKAVSVFNDKHLYHEYAHRATTAWLIHYTRARRGKAGQVSGLASLYHYHPVLAAALAEADVVSESVALLIAKWTNQFPADCVRAADEILIEACRAGASEQLLAEIAAQIRVRVCGPDPEEEQGKLEERTLRLETTLDGAGRVDGNLTPACAALLQAVLDAFGHETGKDDDRSPHERNHDALEAALKLVLAGKKGKPYKAVVHIAFEDLLAMQGASAMIDAYTSQVAATMAARAEDARARRAGQRAAQAVTGGRETWLAGDQALAVLPDAMIVPLITTHLAAGHMEAIASIGAELHRLAAEQDTDEEASKEADAAGGSTTAAREARAQQVEVLYKKLAGEALALVAGPNAVAAWLRRGLLGAPGTGPLGAALAGKSLPLDVGCSKTIPDHLRLAAAIRSPHCQAPGCTQPVWRCEPHHLIHRENGGHTSLGNLDTYCWFHHHILFHKMGWSATLNGDGTATLRKPDGTILPDGPPPGPSG
jgi:hypothetical protein